ncbi:MAG TPA: 6-pyruvoyl-tetrahydropterin synthase-related protein [Candidatus Acidoferrales bacterium]|nr:6-pyruvoyl-tetrahydropterin synthase-related protein [Candidatus Acidoferrales bacterium]
MTAEINPGKQVPGKPSAVADFTDESQAQRQRSLLWSPLLAIGLAAFLVEVPFFFLGTPSGHDVEFHTYSWLDVLAQWKHGVLYPRWAAWANFGYGEPRFIFYPPASWILGALISVIFPWTLATSIYIWIALVAAGASMFLLAGRWLDRPSATFASVLYAVNPYHLVIVYWRSAFAELLAACLIPLLLLFVLEAAEGRQRIVHLGLVLAAAWLTNAPAAVMIHYSLALLILFLAWRKRSPRLLLIGAAAVVLGACLAAFYLLPAIYEQKWVTISQAVSQGSRPKDNFLFVHTTDADHDAFNRVISSVAVLEISLIALSFVVGKLWRRKDAVSNALLVWAAACSILMFPVTLFLWDILPKMRFMQFPWRWLLCLSLIFAITPTIGLRRWPWRAAVCVASLLVIVGAWSKIQAPWWDNAADLREMQDNMSDRIGYEGTDEYTPVGAEPSTIDKTARNVTVDGPARAAIRVQQWNAESKTFTAEMSASDELALRLFPYPPWKAEVNGHVVQTGVRRGTGQMLVPVEAGMNRVQITFVRTWDRRAGGWISGICALGLIGWAMRKRLRPAAP